MSVYFIHVGRYVKVGYSENPERRFRRLFSGATSYSAPWDCPRALRNRTLLGYVPGFEDDEATAHRALADFLVGCEFFAAEAPALDYVDRCIRAGRVLPKPLRRKDGPVEPVGQVPPGADPWSLSELTAARKAATEARSA